MERIVIEVDEAVARKWRLASQQIKTRVARRINAELAAELTESKKDFIQFLDETGTVMQSRGLTETILDDILRDDA